MKVKIVTLCLVTAFASLIGVSSAFAQADQLEIVKIPFAFYVGGQNMPAGTYAISVDLPGDAFTLRDGNGHSMCILGIPNGDGGGKSDVVFDRVGDSYYLTKIDSDIVNAAFPQDKRARAEANVPVEAE
jgi:hypothetical protein